MFQQINNKNIFNFKHVFLWQGVIHMLEVIHMQFTDKGSYLFPCILCRFYSNPKFFSPFAHLQVDALHKLSQSLLRHTEMTLDFANGNVCSQKQSRISWSFSMPTTFPSRARNTFPVPHQDLCISRKTARGNLIGWRVHLFIWTPAIKWGHARVPEMREKTSITQSAHPPHSIQAISGFLTATSHNCASREKLTLRK